MENEPLSVEKIFNRIKLTLSAAQKNRTTLEERGSIDTNHTNLENHQEYTKLLLETEQNNRKWNVNPEFSITSHRPRLGKYIIYGKKAIRKLLRWYINPVFDKQRDFNGSMTRSVNVITSLMGKAVGDIRKLFGYYDELKHKIDTLNLELGKLKENYEIKFVESENQWEEKFQMYQSSIENQWNEKFRAYQSSIENQLIENDLILRSEIEVLRDKGTFLSAQLKKRYHNQHKEIQTADLYINDRVEGSRKSIRENDNQIEIDYFLFEERFRGTRSAIMDRQKYYLPKFSNRGNILDIGCGRGEFIELLRGNNIQAKGIDLNKDMIGYCEERGFDVELVNALDYLSNTANNTFDGIFMAQVIEHLSNQQALNLIEGIYRTLKPGGLIAIETINVQSVFAMSNWFYMDPTHVQPVHPETLKFILQGIGFMTVEIEYLSPVPDKGIPPLYIDGVNTEYFNKSIEDVNGLLYGFQDYVIFATK